MSLDLPTSLAVTVFASAVAGCLLLMSWLHHRRIVALVFWGVAFILAAVAVSLIAARGSIPDIWSIAVANVILAIAYGSMWSGARSFESRPIRVFGALAGAVIWLLASVSSAFYDTPTARATLTAAIGITYTLLTARELWRARGDTLVSRLPIIILLLLHAASLPARIPLVGTIAHTEPARTDLLAFVMFESVLLCMAAAYLFGSIVKERVALWYRHASLIDPLTGVANRRAFLKQGARLLRRSTAVNRSVALLLFDLDRFKGVNDQYGHAVGDGVLAGFCRVATEELRPTDFLARMGGEEFACLLPDTSQQNAIVAAERIRTVFAQKAHELAAQPLLVTTSVGVAATDDPSCDLASLLRQADAALYRAKRLGRNRVECAAPPPARSPVPVPRTA
jgi:diguanylate cyclase (GGDEF)-like protein